MLLGKTGCLSFSWLNSIPMYIEWTLEQHGFELPGSTYKRILFPLNTFTLHDPSLVEPHDMEPWKWRAIYKVILHFSIVGRGGIYTTSFICSSVDGHLGCFHTLDIVKIAAINMGMNISLRYPVFIFFEYIPRSKTAGPYGSSIFFFFWKFYF